MEQARGLLQRLVPTEAVRWRLLSWLHRALLHCCAALYVAGALDLEASGLASAYFLLVALLHAHLFAAPGANALAEMTRILVCCCTVIPLAGEVLLWVLVWPLSGHKHADHLTGLLPACAGTLGLAHSWWLSRSSPERLARLPGVALGGRTWRLCQLLVLCAALGFNAYGAAYCLGLLAMALSLSSPWMAQRLPTSALSCWQILAWLGRAHLLAAGLSYWLFGGDPKAWWLPGPRSPMQSLQCLCVLVFVGEVRCDAAAADAEEAHGEEGIEVGEQDHVGRLVVAADWLVELPGKIPAQLLEAACLCSWAVAWPSLPSFPLLFLGFWILWSPRERLLRRTYEVVLCYCATLCLASYVAGLLLSEEHARGRLMWICALLLEQAANTYVLSTLLALTLSLSYCTSRGLEAYEGEGSSAPLEDFWVARAVRGLCLLRVCTVAIVLYSGIIGHGSDAKSSLIKLGYLIWFVVHLRGKDPVNVETRGWDVLGGHRGLWQLLFVYSGSVATFFLLWQALELSELPTIGFLNTENRLWPHMAVAVLAAVQKAAMKEQWMAVDPFSMSPAAAGAMLRFGVVSQILALLLAVMVSPATTDSFILLLILVAILTAAQVGMQRSVLLPLLGLIANVARTLLILRGLTALPLVQERLAAALDPERYPVTWKSLALHTSLVSPWTQYLVAVLLILSRSLISAVRLSPDLLDEDVYLLKLGTKCVQFLPKAEAVFPWLFLLLAYVGTAAYPINPFTSFTLLAVLVLLLTGRGWNNAGTVISACVSLALLAQYVMLFDFMKKHCHDWAFSWSNSQVCTEFALMFLCILQPLINRTLRAAAQAGVEAAGPSLPPPEAAEQRVFIYDAQTGAMALLLLALLQSSLWSVAFAIVAAAFLLCSDAPKELAVSRARLWLNIMAVMVFIGLAWQNVICVWRRFLSGGNLARVVFTDVCVYYDTKLRAADGSICAPEQPDCVSQFSLCQADWLEFMRLSGESGPAEFVVFLGLCFLAWGHPCLPARAPAQPARPAAESVLGVELSPVSRASTNEQRGSLVWYNSEGEGDSPRKSASADRRRSGSGGEAAVAATGTPPSWRPATPTLQDCDDAGKPELPTAAVSRPSTPRAEGDRAPTASGAATERVHQRRMLLVYVTVISTWLSMCGAFLVQETSNAIAMGYLWLVFLELSTLYDLNIGRDPIAEHMQMIRVIGIFNFLVVLISLVFQSPEFPCPFGLSFEDATGESGFLSKEQCLKAALRPDRKSSHPLGVLFNCLGLMKTAQPLFGGAFSRWNLVVCCSVLIESICLLRWQAEILQHVHRQREKLEFHAAWYMEQHKLSRQFQLAIWDTKREVLLEKLSRLTDHLDAIREIWDGQREAFTEEEEKEYLWATRVENLCLKSGIQRDCVETLLHEFNSATHSEQTGALDSQTARLMIIAVDRLLLQYLHQLLLRLRRKITKEEEEAAKTKLLQECRSLDLLAAVRNSAQIARRPSVLYDQVARVSSLNEERRRSNGDVELQEVGDDAAEQASTDQQASIERAAAPEPETDGDGSFLGMIRHVCYDLIDDFLFISRQDQTQFEHRRRSSLLQLFLKVVYSQVTTLLICATMLQFLEYRSVPAAVSVAGICLSLSVYPQVPWRAWTLLYRWNCAVVFTKILFQLEIFCRDGTLNLDGRECGKLDEVPWTAIFGLVKAHGSGCGQEAGNRTVGGMLWADLLVCGAVLVNMFAALQSGRCGNLQEESIHPASSPTSSTMSVERVESTHTIVLSAAVLERIRDVHYIVWKATVSVMDPGSDLSMEHFMTSTCMRRPSKDLYAFRFSCILVLLALLVFNWQAMSGEGRSLDEALSSNHFSGTQVLVLILFMLLIVCDRVLYTWYRSDLYSEGRQESGAQRWPSVSDADLSAASASAASASSVNFLHQGGQQQLRVFVRMLHQTLLVTHIFIIHVVFMLRWRSDSVLGVCLMPSLLRGGKLELVLFYVLYLLYIVLTSLQLRYDVHIVRGGMRFTKSTDPVTKLFFRAYSGLPFLHELRVLTDWTATVTSLDFFMWMKLEDAQHNLYRVKGDMEIRAMIPPGEKRPVCEKLYMGGLLLFLLLGLLIGPILYFSSLNVMARTPNPVVSVELTVILEIASDKKEENPWVRSLPLYKAQAQMIETESTKLPGESYQTVSFPTSSDSFWMISPSARDNVAGLLGTGQVVANVVLSYVFERQSTAVKATGRDVSKSLDKDGIQEFAKVLDLYHAGQKRTINVESIFRPRKRLTSGAKVIDLDKVLPGLPVHIEIVNLGNGSLPYWQLSPGDSKCQESACQEGISCKVTSDDIASNGSSIHSLYVGVVLTIGNFLRLIFKDSSKRVIYEELPDTDLLLDLCDGIYIARIQRDLDTEYKLYYELIRVFRSPELLARVSQPKAVRQKTSVMRSSESAESSVRHRPRLKKKGTGSTLPLL